MLPGVKLIGLRSSDDHGPEVGYLSASLEQSTISCGIDHFLQAENCSCLAEQDQRFHFP